jgi:hypothetical protein
LADFGQSRDLMSDDFDSLSKREGVRRVLPGLHPVSVPAGVGGSAFVSLGWDVG